MGWSRLNWVWMWALVVLLAPLIVLGVILALACYVAALAVAPLLDLVRSC